MSDINLKVQEEQPLLLRYVEAKVKPEQSKSVVPTYEPQTVLPDAGMTLGQVDVAAIPDPTEEMNITENDSFDVRRIGTVHVKVPQGVFPEGTLNITENGVANVRNYDYANVNVSPQRTPVLLDTIDVADFAEPVNRINIDATKYDLTNYMMLYAVGENVALTRSDWLYFGDSYATGRYLDRSSVTWNFVKLLFAKINNQWAGTIGATSRTAWHVGGDTTPLSTFFFVPYQSTTNFVSGRIYIYAI